MGNDLDHLAFKTERIALAWGLPVSSQAKLLAAFLFWAADEDGRVAMSSKEIAYGMGLGIRAATADGYDALARKVRRWVRELREAGAVRYEREGVEGAYVVDVPPVLRPADPR